MFRLTREVRFAVNVAPDQQLQGQPSNSFGGFPSLTGLGYYFSIAVTLSGELEKQSQYLLNIKEVDRIVRTRAVPLVDQIIRAGEFGGGAAVLARLFELLRDAWPPATLDSLRLSLSPTLSLAIDSLEHPMVRLSQKFEFSASHRLHTPQLSEDENRKTFGKCNNPHGHGHNYEVQVTLIGRPDARGVLLEIPRFEQIVAQTVIEPFDHKNLNLDVPEFAEVIPSVENIAMVIFRRLKGRFAAERAELASVTVWETPKTWCEYTE